MKHKILKRMIILCWIVLIVCFAIKLFGGNFFQIMVENKIYQAICSYVDKHVWTQIIIGSISTILLNTLFLLAINRKLKFTKIEWIIVIASSIIGTIVKVFSPIIGLIIDCYQMFILPFIIKSNALIEHKIRYVIFGNILVILFQNISAITKNLTITFLTTDLVTAFIYSIDVFIMCTLYYLYANLKQEVKMSWIMSWLWGKSETQLEKMKANRLKKIDKINKEIEAIDAEIAKKNESKN